jgi:hypothetical protein
MSYSTAYDRWAGVGPYYAMFPNDLVKKVILAYTEPKQRILDPFAGRASTVFTGAVNGRPSIGIEINPIGWIYGKTKLVPAQPAEVKARLAEIVEATNKLPKNAGENLPEFFSWCFSQNSLRFLLTARDNLNWKYNKVDRTLMTLILIDLHGVRERSFSNQMRQSRAMFPDYSIKWWKEHRFRPPEIDPKEFLEKKIQWRYAKGLPDIVESTVWLGDSCDLMWRVHEQITRQNQKPFKLLFTSPPYLGISDYHRDQWLRLWMLGGEPAPKRNEEKYKRNFASATDYKKLLSRVFLQAAEVMSQSGYVYVRIDVRKQTFDVTHEVLREAFPKWREETICRPYSKQTQTALYGDKSKKPGEKDIILTGPKA